MERYVVLRDDRVLVCLYARWNFTWTLVSEDIVLRMNGIEIDNMHGKMDEGF